MTCWSLVVYLLKCYLKFICLVFPTLSYPFTNYPSLRSWKERKEGKEEKEGNNHKTVHVKNIFHCSWEKKQNKTKQLRKVPLIPYKANVYLFEYFWFFPLSTQTFFFLNFFFYILLIAFKVFLCLFVLGVYSSQCILEYAWDWDKSPESREEKSESYFFLYICTLYYLEEILMGKNSL